MSNSGTDFGKGPCADLEGGRGDPPLEFAKLNIADITGNEQIS